MRRLYLIQAILAITVLEATAQRFTLGIPTLSDLANFPLPNINTNAYVAGGTNINDGFGGLYTYDAFSAVSTNDAAIKPNSTTGRWIRTIPQSTSPISLTAGYIPYADSATTLDDSPLYRINTNKFGFNSTEQFFFYDGSPGNQSVGHQALDSISGGATENTAFGYQTLTASTGGDANTAIGTSSMASNLTGSQNTAVGFSSLFSNLDGNDNVAIGANAMILTTNVISTVGIGVNSLALQRSGDGVVAVGTGAGAALTTGSWNTFIGGASDTSSGTLTNAIAIGYNAVVDVSNKIKIGDAATVTRLDMGGVSWVIGTGDPENNVTANVGSFYSRTDGGAATSFYVKEAGSGSVGWIPK